MSPKFHSSSTANIIEKMSFLRETSLMKSQFVFSNSIFAPLALYMNISCWLLWETHLIYTLNFQFLWSLTKNWQRRRLFSHLNYKDVKKRSNIEKWNFNSFIFSKKTFSPQKNSFFLASFEPHLNLKFTRYVISGRKSPSTNFRRKQ